MNQNKKILLVIDDNALLICLYQTAFMHAGYTVVCAHSGDEGIYLASLLKPSNVILDLLMPGTDGFEVLRTLKSDPAMVNIGVIALAVNANDEELKKAKDLGATACLIKSELTLEEIVERSVALFL